MRGAALLVLCAGCFPSISDRFVCAVDADCESGRTCQAELCLPETDVGVDAGPIDMPQIEAPPDAPVDARVCAGGDARATDAAGRCFVAFRTAVKTRAAAELACKADAMELAIVTSAASNVVVQSLVTGIDAYLGATDAVTETQFLWPDGTGLTFSNFRAGEPNNGNGTLQEDCLVIEGGKGGTWDDRPCDRAIAYVCSF
jgi:Lectin C-type domain